MATKTATGLTAILAGNLDDTAVAWMDDKNAATRKATVAQLRTALRKFLGSSTTQGEPVQVIYANRNLTDTTGSIVTLATYTLPANALSVNNQMLRVTIVGRDSGVTTTGGTSVGRQIGIRFGSTSIIAGGESWTSNVPANEFEYVAYIIRTGAATQDLGYRMLNNGNGLVAGTNVYRPVLADSTGTATETLSGSVAVDIRGAASNDGGSATNGTLTIEQVLIEYLAP